MVKTALPANVVPPVRPAKPEWFPDWSCCAIIASGPSAGKAPVALLQGRMPVIAINTSYQLALWADMLYGCDLKWWKAVKGAPDFHGVKVCADKQAIHFGCQIVKVEAHSNQLKLDVPGELGASGNSGFQALNLAVQFGCRKILLIGFDMTIEHGEHWHKRHPHPLSNPHPADNIPRWRRGLDAAGPPLRRMGIEVINASQVSALTSYQKMSVEECLKRWGCNGN